MTATNLTPHSRKALEAHKKRLEQEWRMELDEFHDSERRVIEAKERLRNLEAEIRGINADLGVTEEPGPVNE